MKRMICILLFSALFACCPKPHYEPELGDPPKIEPGELSTPEEDMEEIQKDLERRIARGE